MDRRKRLITSSIVLAAAALLVLVLAVLWVFLGYGYRVLPPTELSVEAGKSAFGLL